MNQTSKDFNVQARSFLVWFQGLGLLILGWTFMSSSTAFCRWMEPDEAGAKIISQHEVIHLEEDGTFESTESMVMKIERDDMRSYGTQKWEYSPENEKLTFEKGEVENNEKTEKVSSRQIVDSFIESSGSGFDRHRELTVSFPNVKKGTILRFTVHRKVFKPVIARRAQFYFAPGRNLPTEKFSAEIHSPKPLFKDIYDQSKSLVVEEINEPKSGYILKISNNKTLLYEISDEKRVIFPYEFISQIFVSNHENMASYYEPLVPAYEKIIQKATPESFADIIQKAREIKEPLQQIEFVVSTLADRIRYMGDWRSDEGAIIPHSLDEIAQRSYGDCKDMATLLTHMLRQLGFEADVALILRREFPKVFPRIGYSAFNHAITAVKLKKDEDRYLWIDPTNFKTYIKGIYSDIANRPALLLKPTGPILTSTSKNYQEKESITIKSKVKISGPSMKMSSEIHLSGQWSLRLTGMALSHSKQEIETYIKNAFFSAKPQTKLTLEPLDLTHREVRDIKIKAHANIPFEPQISSTGPAIPLEAASIIDELGLVHAETRASHFHLGSIGRMYYEDLYKNIRAHGKENLNCSLKSPWLNYDLKVGLQPAPKVSITLDILKDRISIDEIRSAEFRKFHEKLKKCASNRAIVYN